MDTLVFLLFFMFHPYPVHSPDICSSQSIQRPNGLSTKFLYDPDNAGVRRWIEDKKCPINASGQGTTTNLDIDLKQDQGP